MSNTADRRKSTVTLTSSRRASMAKSSSILAKEPDDDKLAREFPLLFGKTSQDRSVSGKYVNKAYEQQLQQRRKSTMATNTNNNNNENQPENTLSSNSTANHQPTKTHTRQSIVNKSSSYGPTKVMSIPATAMQSVLLTAAKEPLSVIEEEVSEKTVPSTTEAVKITEVEPEKKIKAAIEPTVIAVPVANEPILADSVSIADIHIEPVLLTTDEKLEPELRAKSPAPVQEKRKSGVLSPAPRISRPCYEADSTQNSKSPSRTTPSRATPSRTTPLASRMRPMMSPLRNINQLVSPLRQSKMETVGTVGLNKESANFEGGNPLRSASKMDASLTQSKISSCSPLRSALILEHLQSPVKTNDKRVSFSASARDSIGEVNQGTSKPSSRRTSSSSVGADLSYDNLYLESQPASGIVNDAAVLNALRTYLHKLDNKKEPKTPDKSVDVTVSTSPIPTVQVVPVTDEYVGNIIGDTDVVPQEQIQAAKVEMIIQYPRQQMMMNAMEKSLLVAELFDRWQRDGVTRFIVHITMMDIPGITDERAKNFRLMALKRFSDFKMFRQNLSIALSTSGEGIPPLPTRQLLSMGYDNSEEGFMNARQKYLGRWLNNIMARQSVEGDKYRKVIMEFFTS